MTNLMLRSILNRTLVVSCRNVTYFEKWFQTNLRNARGMSIRTISRASTCSSCKNILRVKTFSTSSVNYVKIFVETENKHAHVVMESNPGYSERLYKRISLECIMLSKEEYGKYINNDWCSSSTPELLSAFKGITSYCVEHSIQITEPELTNICKAVSENCRDFSDEELIVCLECLTCWPETESLTSVNFVDVWNALDKACWARVKDWDVKTMLYVADIWYSLHLSRISKYVGECIWRLGRKTKHLSPQELVQCMFYMNSSRKFKIPGSMYEFEFYLEQSIQNLSVDELSILAMGFFKSETPIRSPRVMGCMIHKTAAAIDSINEITLCSLMKLFRYCLPLTLVDDMYKLLDETVPIIGRVSLFCCVQIALSGTPTQLLHRPIIDAVARRFIEDISTCRLKDLERMIFVLTLYNYIPECASDLLDRIVAELQSSSRSREIHQYPKNLAYCVHFLSVAGVYPTELVDKVLSKEFIEETYDRKNLYALGRELLCLDVALEIDCPAYEGNRLERRARTFLAKKHTKWVPDRSKKNLSVTERIFIEVMEAVEEVVGAECVYADIISPNYTLPDIVVGVDGNGNGIPVSGLFSKYNIGDVKYSPNTQRRDHTWFCFVVGSMNMFIRNENLPLGTTNTRLRHLTNIGYQTILVPWFEFTGLTATEKPRYLRNKMFPNCKK